MPIDCRVLRDCGVSLTKLMKESTAKVRITSERGSSLRMLRIIGSGTSL